MQQEHTVAASTFSPYVEVTNTACAEPPAVTEVEVAECPEVEANSFTTAQGQPTLPLPKVVKPSKPVRADRLPLPAGYQGIKGGNKGWFGVTRAGDLPWCEKKHRIFAALHHLGACDPTTAAGSSQVAEVAGVSSRDVRHYCYHAQAGGLAGVVQLAAGSNKPSMGYGYYLTTEGEAELANRTATVPAGNQQVS